MSAFDEAKKQAKVGAATTDAKRLAEAKKRLEASLTARDAYALLEPQAVADAALVFVHDTPLFARLKTFMKDRKVDLHGLWAPKVKDAIKQMKAASAARAAQNDPYYPLVAEWIDALGPSHRASDGGIYTRAAGLLKLSHVHPPPDLLKKLAAAKDAEYEELVRAFGVRLRVHWGHLQSTLPADDVAKLVADLIKAPAFSESPGLWEGKKRALGTWVHWYATRPDNIGDFVRFGSKDIAGVWWDLDKGPFQIAIQKTLAAQISKRDHVEIDRMSDKLFAQQCAAAGIIDTLGRADNRLTPKGEKQSRWVTLTAKFVADLDLSYDHGEEQDKRRGEALYEVVYGKAAKH